MKKSTAVSERYATALYALASERGLRDAVGSDLQTIASWVKNSTDFNTLLESPILGTQAQLDAVSSLAQKAGLTDITANFLGVLTKARRLSNLSGMIAAYQAKLAIAKGEHRVSVTSATALRPGQIEALRANLAAKLGGSVEMDLTVDQSLLGGLVVQAGSRMIDMSLRGKLERIGFAMKGTV